MLKLSSESIRLVIHDDGSLTPEDMERLVHELENCHVVSREEANDRVSQQIKNYPNCTRYRYEQAYSLKLLDIPLLSEGDIAYCDSDVLFLKPFTGLFHLSDPDVSAAFMMDCREAYSILPWHLMGANRIKLPSKVNVGLIFLRKQAHDLDFLEWCLSDSNREFKSIPNWIEQTCWAALGQRVGCQLWNPKQVVLVQSHKSITDEVVAAHFVSTVRGLLWEFYHQIQISNEARSPVSIDTIPAKDCDLLALSHSLLRHRLGGVKHRALKTLQKGYKASWE